jgi:hypothetical protein
MTMTMTTKTGSSAHRFTRIDREAQTIYVLNGREDRGGGNLSTSSATVRSTTAFLLALGCGCQTGGASCPSTCTESAPATFVLSCDSSDLTAASASGPCALSDAGLHVVGTWLTVGSPSAGQCQVTLTFATGFQYSTDVTFVSQTDPAPHGCGACPAYFAATESTFMVDNPPATCADAASVEGPEAAAGGD